MVPIHDTDIAEERWSKAEWENYELWEKTELRLRRRKWLWIGCTVVVFLGLSAVPIVIDRWPRWTALASVRRLAQEMNALKRDAAIEHQAFRLRFAGQGSLSFIVEKSADCRQTSWKLVREGALLSGPKASDYVLLDSKSGAELGASSLVETYCYDPLSGGDVAGVGGLLGFAIIPVKDLTPSVPFTSFTNGEDVNGPRLDRIAVLLLNGPVGESSFE